jgi:hypothetical protein
MELPAGFRFKILKDGSGLPLDFDSAVGQVARLTQMEVRVVDSKEHVVLVVGGTFKGCVGPLVVGGISIEIM